MNPIRLLCTTTVAFLMVACSNHEETEVNNFPDDGIVRISTNVNELNTRGFHTTDDLNEFGISISNSKNPYYCYDNIKVTGSNASGWTTESVMLWQNSTQPVDIIAYTPYQTGAKVLNGTLEAGVQAAQTKDDKSSDVLLSVQKGFVPGSGLNSDKKLEIPFSHAFSKLVISITLGTEFNAKGKNISATNPITNITIGGTVTKAVCDLTADAPAFEAKAGEKATDIIPYETGYTPPADDNGHGVATYECILVPQQIPASKLRISFTINGTEYTWISEQAALLEPGTSYNLPLTAGNEVIIANKLTIGPWYDNRTSGAQTEYQVNK